MANLQNEILYQLTINGPLTTGQLRQILYGQAKGVALRPLRQLVAWGLVRRSDIAGRPTPFKARYIWSIATS